MNTFLNEYKEGRIRTYIVSAASLSEISGCYSSSDVRMNQKGTKYNLGLRSYIAGDADDSKEKLDRIYHGKFVIDYEFSREIEKAVTAYVTSTNYSGYFHITKDCCYISQRDDFIELRSIRDARAHGGSILCPECRKKFMEDKCNE